MKFVIGSSPGNGEPTQLSRSAQKNCGSDFDRRVLDEVAGVRAGAGARAERVLEAEPVADFVRAGIALIVGQDAIGFVGMRTARPVPGSAAHHRTTPS